MLQRVIVIVMKEKDCWLVVWKSERTQSRKQQIQRVIYCAPPLSSWYSCYMLIHCYCCYIDTLLIHCSCYILIHCSSGVILIYRVASTSAPGVVLICSMTEPTNTRCDATSVLLMIHLPLMQYWSIAWWQEHPAKYHIWRHCAIELMFDIAILISWQGLLGWSIGLVLWHTQE